MDKQRMPSLLLLLLLAGVTTGQDVNWGKKVKCFVLSSQVLCPGCRQRAGLSCPRRPEDRLTFDSCLPSSIAPLPFTRAPTAPPTQFLPPVKKGYVNYTAPVLTTFESTTPETTTFQSTTPEGTTFESTSFEPYDDATLETEPSFSDGFVSSRKKYTWRKFTKKATQSTTPAVQESTVASRKEDVDSNLVLYLYRILGPPRRRIVRDSRRKTVVPEEDLETCNWNGDCPCPLICCRRGEGCPKKCIMGIRLPPPFG